MNSPPAQTQTYTNNNWMNELYRPYETSRLILQRTNQEDYEPLGRIIMKKNVNYYYQRPIMHLENLDSAINYMRNHCYNTVSFTIKLKAIPNPIPIGQIGFYYTDRTYRDIGIFYFIGDTFQKKGYAAEAACPLIKHLFEILPMTQTLKIDFCDQNIASRKVALLICNDIMKAHPNYIFGELTPFIDKYTLIEGRPFWGKVKYYFDGYDTKKFVDYPNYFFNNTKYFEVRSEGFYITKQ